MSFVIYFLLFAVIVFSVSAYVITTCPMTVMSTNHHLALEQGLSSSDMNVNSSLFSIHSFINSTKKKSNNKTNEQIKIEEEVKKHRNQLKRNLKTLNYIALLQANPNIIKDPKQLEEIKNLKEGIERQIVRSTKLLNNYKQVQ